MGVDCAGEGVGGEEEGVEGENEGVGRKSGRGRRR